MFCGNCGAKNDPKFAYCDSCGSTLTGGATPPAAPSAAPAVSHAAASHSESATSSVLQLTTWAGLRWLFATNYGQLSISEAHLNHKITKLWASNIYSIIVKIFTWGFDVYSSVFVNSGSTALKSVTTVRIFALNWIIWRGHFLFIFSGGLPDVYAFSGKQIREAEAFVAALKKAAAEAKYQVSK